MGRTRSGTERDSALGKYLAEIRRLPMLEREEERELGARARSGDESAVSRLVEANLRFVVKIAKEYRDRGVPLDDLINEGNLGLMDAARRFDPDRGTKFTNWAVWSIRKAILAALCEQGSVVRLPASQIARMREVRGAKRELRETLGREPSTEEMAARLPDNLAGLDPIHLHGLRITSLDEPVTDDTTLAYEETLADTSRPSIEAQMVECEMIDRALDSFGQLEESQRTVIAHRLGLDGRPPLTLTELGRHVGMTHEGVRKVECRATARLRKLFRRNVYGPPSDRPLARTA
jgi:RNA polymerase primary sigma factor